MFSGLGIKANENLIKIENRLDIIQAKLNILTTETSIGFTSDELSRIIAEIVKIDKRTRYEQYREDQKKFGITN